MNVEEVNQVQPSLENTFEQIPEDEVEVIEIEGCEYIIYKGTPDENQGFGFMSHKGNCRNPIHFYNQKMDSSIESQLTKTSL